MDSIDVWDTPLVGNKLEVDEVNNRPDLPRSLAGSQKIVPNLVSNSAQGVSVNKSKVGEEDTHEDGAPEKLINGNL